MIAAWWKSLAIVLAGALIAVSAGAGVGWWLAVASRDEARADLKTEQGVSAELRAAIGAQNAAIGKLGQEKLEAEARGLAAQQQAIATGQRYDSALRRMDGARVASCADAMPYVNRLLGDVR